MSKRKDSENVSPDTERQKICADTSHETSSVDVDTSHETPSVDADTSHETSSVDADTSHETSSVDADNMDIPDTLTLARLDRENQGPWEAEYSYGGEADLHRHLDSCDKNPGHKKFIPVDKFSIEDLPQGYRDNDVVEYIRSVSDLTVRVTVQYVSDRRPATVPGSDKSYPGYSVRGQRRMTVGTGWVDYVDVYNAWEGETCECKDCRNSSTPETNFAIIYINTAAHVVFDDLEAEHTTCHLFFDRGGTPDTCSGVVTLTGMSCSESNIERDLYYMEHYTHDLDLAHRLHQTCQQREELGYKISTKLPQTSNYKWRLVPVDRQPLLFVVSHPHGCSKQISLGRFTRVDRVDSNICSWLYTTATCPGSSGAPVCLPLGLTPPPGWDRRLLTDEGNHCGASVVCPGSNYCLTDTGFDKEQSESMSLDMLQFYGGSWEDNFSCVEEEDLHKHFETCQRNPGHQNVFPVEKFSIDNLPPCYRTDEIMEVIKSVSDLTVRVSVKYVSEERPETVPGTVIRYPWYSNRGGNQMRVGSGRITDVGIYKNNTFYGTCKCKECRNSLTPKSQFAHIKIKTAAHLVYDRLEGEHTTCHLLFDSGETPDVCKDVVTFTDFCDIWTDTKSDKCMVIYVTHDLDLADRLRHMLKMYIDCLQSLDYSSDADNFMDYIKQNDIKNTKQEPPLHIMVSHPHGCAKHVGIIYCGNHDNADTEENQYPDTSIPCPGSSGAPVIVLGRESVYPCCG